jgi:anti-sigma regulatory factor (Ser/Thr protein kinase)
MRHPRDMESLTVTYQHAGIQVVFPSALAQVDMAVQTLMAFVRQHRVPCRPFDLELVLREGLTNAVTHGNHLDPTRRVQCAIQVRPAELCMTITDEGEGFAWHEKITQMPPGDVLSGRGLWLMQLYGFQVHYNATGNVLVLTKSLSNTAQGGTQ